MAFVVERGASGRPLGLPADGLRARFPTWRARTVSILALRLNRPECRWRACACCRRTSSRRPGSDPSGRFGAASSGQRMSARGRTEASASVRSQGSKLERRLSGDESDEPAGSSRPQPAGQLAPKQPDGDPSRLLFRFYEAVVCDLTHPAPNGRPDITKIWGPVTGLEVQPTWPPPRPMRRDLHCGHSVWWAARQAADRGRTSASAGNVLAPQRCGCSRRCHSKSRSVCA